jgi:hypothetical protein
VSRSSTVMAASTRVINAIAGILITLNDAGSTTGQQISIFNTGAAVVSLISTGAMIGGTASAVSILPGNFLNLVFDGANWQTQPN